MIQWSSDTHFLIVECVENLQHWGPFLTSPLGANLDPRGEFVPRGKICPLGVKLSPGGEILCSPLHSSKQ
jgi:hypothetical protein